MKKAFFLLLSILMIVAGTLSGPVFASDEFNPLKKLEAANNSMVVEDIASQVVAKLPDDIHFRLLAIAPIEGDSGALVDALTSQIKENTRYHLIERGDLNTLLKEQGVQLSAIVDSRTPVEPGKIKGVEGILMGKVTQDNVSFLFGSMEVFIKLDNVEGGDVVFADSFSAHYLPPTTLYGGIAILVLLLLAIFSMRRGKVKVERTANVVRKDSSILLATQAELKKVRDNLNRVHDALVAKEMMPLSVSVRDSREEVSRLLSDMEQAPSMHPDNMDDAAVRHTMEHGKKMGGLVKNLLAESENMIQVTQSGGGEGIQASIQAFQGEMKYAANTYKDRSAGKA